MAMSELSVAFCWYQPDEWEKLKATAADKENLDDTYDEWKSNASRAIQDLRDEGQHIQKVSIKIEQLEVWCEEEGVDNISQARTQYAVHLLKNRRSSFKA